MAYSWIHVHIEKVKDFSIEMILFSLLLIFIFGNIAALGEEIG
jgi:hypothetical protein